MLCSSADNVFSPTPNRCSNNQNAAVHISGRRLTRQRKIRHLTDRELGLLFTEKSQSLPVSPDSTFKFNSPKWSDHWSSSPVPQPLPLPELSSVSLTGRKSTDCCAIKSAKSTCKHHKEMREALRVHIPVWSAPSSGFSSPTCSPRRYSTEEFTATRNSKCLRAVEGQSHQRLAMESSAIRPEGSNVNVHPLPLPPGTPSSGQPANSCYGKGKQEVSPMRSPWRKGKLIGGGTYGSVYMGINCETGALCAIKEVNLILDDPNSAESIKQLDQEIKLLSQLKHPNIVQYYGSEKVEDRLDIYLEYVYPGSISKYIRELCGAIPESVVRHFTCQILSGLAYLHSMNTVHRDIKGANLLVDASGTVKLADFGLAKHLRGQLAELSLKGSPHWMAPELMQAAMQKGCSSDLAFAVDIWSLGCTIIEMLTGRPPWAEWTGASAMFKALNGSPPIPETLSPEGKDFLSCCFRRNPAERPSAVMLLEHPFLQNLHEQRYPLCFRALSQSTCQ